jgi:NADPH:quinone reductase-like Zn-dependent oxidoreductase
MAAETAYRSLEILRVKAGHMLMLHGAGTTVGFAAVRLALMRGARVVASAGDTYAPQLREFGATVTAYGNGIVERVRAIVGGPPDLILDTAPPSGVLPDLVRIADGDPRRVLTVVDFATAKELGVRDGFGEDTTLRYDMLDEFARWAVEGRLVVPIARTFALDEWDQAREISQSWHARGKLVLLPGGLAAGD